MAPPAGPLVLAAVDVHYLPTGGARAAAVYADERTFAAIVTETVVELSTVAPYRPGAFFERELPAIRAVIGDPDGLALLLIDGYVDLDADGRPGLGAHVHSELGIPVVGVAKTSFRTATHAMEVRRGGSSRPLYVTSAGVSIVEAAELVRTMAGPHRLPTALKRVDSLARGH